MTAILEVSPWVCTFCFTQNVSTKTLLPPERNDAKISNSTPSMFLEGNKRHYHVKPNAEL